ncbi:hypothetical protein [Corallococcus exiguus]|nr:hypothetical protein [Corallococcus exiguus]
MQGSQAGGLTLPQGAAFVNALEEPAKSLLRLLELARAKAC